MAASNLKRTSDLAGIPKVLRDHLSRIYWATGEGAPTNSTDGKDSANIGAMYVDRSTGTVYRNVGTKASPTWDTIAADTVVEEDLDLSATWGIPIPFTIAIRGGLNSDGVQVGSLTHTAFDDVTHEDNSGGTFTDETSDAGDATTGDVTVEEPFDTNDAIYMGYSSKFSGVVINMTTAGAGDAVAAETVWEYYDGDSWETLESGFELVDDSTALTAGTGTYVVSFVPPSDWATVAVDGGTAAYFVRLRATSDDVYNTTTPTMAQLWCMPLDAGEGQTVPYDGTLSAVDLLASTASGTADDTELLLINVTQGTFAQVTWTGGDIADRVTGLSLSVTEGDVIAVQVVAEDGTTEFANGSISAQIDY